MYCPICGFLVCNNEYPFYTEKNMLYGLLKKGDNNITIDFLDYLYTNDVDDVINKSNDITQKSNLFIKNIIAIDIYDNVKKIKELEGKNINLFVPIEKNYNNIIFDKYNFDHVISFKYNWSNYNNINNCMHLICHEDCYYLLYETFGIKLNILHIVNKINRFNTINKHFYDKIVKKYCIKDDYCIEKNIINIKSTYTNKKLTLNNESFIMLSPKENSLNYERVLNLWSDVLLNDMINIKEVNYIHVTKKDKNSNKIYVIRKIFNTFIWKLETKITN